MQIVVNCPPMDVTALWRPWLRQAQELPCPNCVLTMPDGPWPFKVTFPKCLVRWGILSGWVVDEVTASGVGGPPFCIPNFQIDITLPPEPVVRVDATTMKALAVSASGRIRFASGLRGAIKNLVFPDVLAHWSALGKYTVDAVQAIGEWDFV